MLMADPMECLVTHLRKAVDGLQSIDASMLCDEELSGLLVDLHTQSARLDAARVVLTGAWDARRVWSSDGARSAAAWLAHRTHQPRGALNGEVRLARRLRTMPATAAALADGDISADHNTCSRRSRSTAASPRTPTSRNRS